MMKMIPVMLVPAGLTLALWLALRMPGGDFLGQAWMPAAAWVVFIVLASTPSVLAHAFRVDGPTYGPLAFLVGSVIPAVGALVAAAALFVARYAAEAAPTLAEWASSPILGALFVLVMLGAATSMAVMAHRSIGAAGEMPVADRRPTMVSQPDPPRTAAHLLSGRGSPSDPTGNP
jgi:hypothetical protein